MKRQIICLSIIGTMLTPSAVAFAFDPNYLISTEELIDPFALSLEDIQTILSRGYLANYRTEDHEGNQMKAAEIIQQAAIEHKISPKFLITLLQKEQSLIEDDNPSQSQLDWATGYAVCDDCSKSDPSIQRWRGFGKQVNSAAAQFREGYLNDLEEIGITGAGFSVGKKTILEGIPVIPQNKATAALYSYTPHLHGNKNFVRIWNRYFTQKYPSGSLLQVKGKDQVYLIKYGERRPVTSRSALYSRYNPDMIIQVEESVLLQYKEGKPISFPNYSLLKTPDNKIYLIVDDNKRWIETWKAFQSIGFNPDEIIDVNYEDLAAYEDGDPITVESADPQGRLYQNSTSGGIFFVRDGIKHPILSKTILDLRFKNWPIEGKSEAALTKLKTGSPVTLADGTLVKAFGFPTVYVISDGARRPIKSAKVFETMGWNWEDIIKVDSKVIELHRPGNLIDIEFEEQSDLEITTLPEY